MLSTNIKEDFLDLFYHELKREMLENANTLDLFVLKVQNNSFSYDELIDQLGDKLCFFALSRTEIEALKAQDRFNSLVKKAKSKFRDYSSNEGEFGEILLYCFLESHLKAPKLLTKLELKTANNDYVKGADGVHLLKLNDSDYQLVLGESKMRADLKQGIYDAFSSIGTLLSDGRKKLRFELDLVNSQLVKEAFDDQAYSLLKNIILPSARDDEYNLDYSFGIFLGFDINITSQQQQLTNSEFRTNIRSTIKSEVLAVVDSINNQIRKEKFKGYSFYVYVIPFSDLAKTRKDVIENLIA